ncbi:hypothetical protein [Bacillus thermotolerans]|uniref:Uncharacterized protein n=1 Tax=Bacillus thermotolerans TaxID=1221996 RepID=A0A0F5I597_BACTR|nr:hypothetical protein [Bacillus thermotolerans]KKB40834.1 hypothetical protein QY95_01146 [Bacillus thermotolerans]
MNCTQNLDTFIKDAQGIKGEKKLLICQQENPASPASLGDEDTGGTSTELTVQALIESPKGIICFQKTYTNNLHYEEEALQLEQLQESLPTQQVPPHAFEEKMSNRSDPLNH